MKGSILQVIGTSFLCKKCQRETPLTDMPEEGIDVDGENDDVTLSIVSAIYKTY